MLMQSILEGEIFSFFDLTAGISCFAEADAVAGHKELLSLSPELLIAVRLVAQGQLAPRACRVLPAALLPSGRRSQMVHPICSFHRNKQNFPAVIQ